jgi:hypothetical protein
VSLIPLLDRIYDWQYRLPEQKFETIKKICFTSGWVLILIAIIIWISLETIDEGIPGIIIGEGMLVLFVTVMNMDDSTYILSSILWFIGINIFFILLFTGLISQYPVRIR